MKLFQWSRSRSVYMPAMDAEHRAVIQLALELQQTAEGGAGSPAIRRCLRALIATLEDHFSHEEKLMRATRYLSRDWHKQQHDGVRRNVKAFGRQIEAGERTAAVKLVEYLERWLNDHTSVADTLFAAHYRSCERTGTVAKAG